MKIIIRLVGYSEIINNEKYIYEYECIVAKIFNFEIFKIIFNKYNNIITTNELNTCTLTCNSINLKKEFIIDNNDDECTFKVFLFTGNTEIKNKLIDIFKYEGYRILFNKIETNLKTNDSESDESEIDNIKVNEILDKIDHEELDNEEINENIDLFEINQNLELFKDNDFLTLIRIYKNRSYLFNDFYKYINSSQIIQLNKSNDNIDFTQNLNFIKGLNLNFGDEDIIKALQFTENHINLAIRYLLLNN